MAHSWEHCCSYYFFMSGIYLFMLLIPGSTPTCFMLLFHGKKTPFLCNSYLGAPLPGLSCFPLTGPLSLCYSFVGALHPVYAVSSWEPTTLQLLYIIHFWDTFSLIMLFFPGTTPPCLCCALSKHR